MDIRKQSSAKTATQSKLRTYAEIIEYLDAHWSINNTSKTLERTKQLDAALGSPSKKVKTLLVAGTNGKSLTVHLAAKLLRTEGLKVGTFTAPHILTYNERIGVNLESVSNKAFTEVGNDVINLAESLNIQAYSQELLTVMALKFFVEQKVDVAVLEVSQGGAYDATNICHAFATTITRMTPTSAKIAADAVAPFITETMGIVKKDTWIVSGDQSKINLELMQKLAEDQGGKWAMPIRKLAPLPYPFEQLHGRCAALAERIAQLFIEEYVNADSIVTADSILSKPKGKRGRPTLDDKKKALLNPKKTVEQFWKETVSDLPGRFQFDKEKPTVLLDIASNLDAFENLLLGVRLTHYQNPLKGLVIIVAAAKDALYSEEFLKVVRYFFKKTSGQIIICPIEYAQPGSSEDESWDIEKVSNDVKTMKVKARAAKTFEEAFEAAKKAVDNNTGLIVVTGSQSIVNTYWRLKGTKKA